MRWPARCAYRGQMRAQLSLLAVLALALATRCEPGRPERAPSCEYQPPGAPACCNKGAGCTASSGLWCNTARCACEDIEDPCGRADDGGPGADAGTPDGGPVPAGPVGRDGGA